MQDRYKAPRFIAVICRYLGSLLIIGATVCAVMGFMNPALLIIAFQPAFSGFLSIALSEAIEALIDIDDNTRRSSDALQQLVARDFNHGD